MVPFQFKALLVVFALSSVVSTSPTSQPRTSNHNEYPLYVHPSNGICTDYTIENTVTYEALTWALPTFKDNYDVAQFLGNLSSRGGIVPFSGSKNVTNAFKIAATFCEPKVKKDGKETTVLVATHGLGFDSRYWTSTLNPQKYSFAHYALSAGFSIFYYDRLGVGRSQRISGYTNQATPQIELLARIVSSLRAGHYTRSLKAQKIALIGHSFGSSVANGVIAAYPTLADAAILTGYAFPTKTDTTNTAFPFFPSVFGLRIASSSSSPNRPQYADSFDTGYLGFSDMYAYIETFLHQGNYEVDAAAYSFAVSQPLSIAEFLSFGAVKAESSEYRGGLLVTSGEFDYLLCNGDCFGTFRDGLQGSVLPNARVSTYIQPGAGHGQNFGGNAESLYGEVVRFVADL